MGITELYFEESSATTDEVLVMRMEEQAQALVDKVERRMRGNSHVRCGAGENLAITSKDYLLPSTVISNPGVLVGLNSLLDRCDSILLPNGEVVKRHPDTVVVVTTNNDYAGCKQMNQSIISRMNLVIDLEEPDEDTLVERVLGITKCQDKAGVRSMARMVKTISKYCKENLITDGCCGVRELISWVQSYMICGDIREAARYTILTSATADKDSQTEVTGCLDINLAA